MITEFDIDSAIAECQGKKNPDARTCMMLAAFLTIKKEMFGKLEYNESPALYSYASPPENQSVETITYQSKTEFSQAIQGRYADDVFAVMDYLMSMLQALNPRLYNSVMRKIQEG